MAQIFHRSTNFISRFSVFSFIFLIGWATLAVLDAARSPYMTRQNITREQPVQFSHKHHTGDDGIVLKSGKDADGRPLLPAFRPRKPV